jgi:transposase-like protein
MIDFKGSQFEKEIILWGVRWYVAYSVSYRQLEEMMGERGVAVDHSTLNRWVIKYAPEIEKQFRCHQRPVGRRALVQIFLTILQPGSMGNGRGESSSCIEKCLQAWQN